MYQALSMFKVNFFEENVQEDHPLYNNIFLNKYIIEIASNSGYILPNISKFIELNMIKDKTNPTGYKIVYGRL